MKLLKINNLTKVKINSNIFTKVSKGFSIKKQGGT